MKYYEIKEGEWITPVEKEYKLMCRDCGATYKFDFKINDGEIQFRVFRDYRATGQHRRYMKKD